MKKLAILGSTGSIGRQTLEIVREEKDLKAEVLAAGSNIELMEEQIREFKPKIAVIFQEDKAKELKQRIKDTDVRVLSGMDGLIEGAVCDQVSIVVTSMVGMIGIRPTIAAIEAGKDIALANKETLVTAGHIIMPLAKKRGVKILPVDSEHSAIFQSLQGENRERIESLILTASGGPFRGKTREELREVSLDQALKHPNWSMGRKITVDSATMVNKGLEMMEARWLFDVPLDKIQVIVHPQSIIHSGVEFEDGAVIAELGMPDMKLPIQYALFYPDRRYLNTKRVKFTELATLTFEKPDIETFRGLGLAIEAGNTGGTMPTVFNAANERAVGLFLDHKIGFLDIDELIEYCMERHKLKKDPSVSEILEAEKESLELIEKRVG
ncbi:MAG: 1-deoxy-D-xylulose-5-phosphate reductoisomerase [Lachnospiraceae bacterium]|nr:1-deoxy-D-xylulose-5-phosphate reductoisomerase [Lachnospiraceae bacterium]